MAYSSFESFINEVSQLSQTLARRTTDSEGELLVIPDWLGRLSLAMRVAEDQRASSMYRYDLAWEILTGQLIDRSSGSRQMLNTFTSVRNDLVHMKSNETEIFMHVDPVREAEFDGIWLGEVKEKHPQPSYLRSLETRNILAEGDEFQAWFYRICTPAIANWACDLTEQLAHDLVAQAPINSEFRKRLIDYSLGGTITRETRVQ